MTTRWSTKAFFLSAVAVMAVTVTAADGDRTVLYPKYKSGGGGGLVCYKDRRADGGAFWTYATEQQRRPYVFHCPSSLSTWCVNVITGQLSDRGCSGPSGVNRAGCFRAVNAEHNATSNVCFCNRNYCNRAAVIGTSSSSSLSLWTTSLVAATAVFVLPL